MSCVGGGLPPNPSQPPALATLLMSEYMFTKGLSCSVKDGPGAAAQLKASTLLNPPVPTSWVLFTRAKDPATHFRFEKAKVLMRPILMLVMDPAASRARIGAY